MAYFAKIGLDNVVLNVIKVDNINTMTPEGEIQAEIGVAFLTNMTGHETWVMVQKGEIAIGKTYGTIQEEPAP
jgi:hypothetical protein